MPRLTFHVFTFQPGLLLPLRRRRGGTAGALRGSSALGRGGGALGGGGAGLGGGGLAAAGSGGRGGAGSGCAGDRAGGALGDFFLRALAADDQLTVGDLRQPEDALLLVPLLGFLQP